MHLFYLVFFLIVLVISYLNYKSGKDVSYVLIFGAMCLCFYLENVSKKPVLRKIYSFE